MNKRIITLMAAALALLSAAGQVAFTGVDPAHHVIRLGADRTTGLDSIYVIYDIHGVGMTYTSDTGASVVWKSYNDSRGEAYAEVVDGISHMGNVSTLGQVKSNTGYVIEEGASRASSAGWSTMPSISCHWKHCHVAPRSRARW